MEFNLKQVHFTAPVKRIFNLQATHDFQHSLAMYRLQTHLDRYLQKLNGLEIPVSSTNNNVIRFIRVIERLEELLEETPLQVDTPSRFGNLAYREWYDKMQGELELLCEKFVPNQEIYKRSIVELKWYLGNSFGSRERLDYGTGHELSFLALVIAIEMLGIWKLDNYGEISLSGVDLLFIWYRYYLLVHRLILTYTLEPAGSHGVWGLDDHFHLQYLMGASQFVKIGERPSTSPSDILNRKFVSRLEHTNLYCNAIAFVLRVKSGPFNQHSPTLFDISRNVRYWHKVVSGLTKMYQVEVLNKFPVVQHFWFGTGFYPWVDMAKGVALTDYEAGQDKVDEGLGARPQNIGANKIVQPSRAPAGSDISSFGKFAITRRWHDNRHNNIK